MLPTLNGYARSLTGKPKIRIELSETPGARTNGDTIFIRPPMSLGDNTPHERTLCDRRDENRQNRCPACAARESTLIMIYHEIAHISYNSFDAVSELDKRRLLSVALSATSTKYADEVRAKIASMPSHATRTYLGMAEAISPFLPPIVNALEDARVNNQMVLARPGTHTMFAAQAWDVFTNGFEQPDGTMARWSEAPLNMQVIIAMFAKASDYDYSAWFAPETIAALDDPELATIVDEVSTATGPGDIYGISFRALLRLRKLGYCKSDTDPDDDEEEAEVEEEPPFEGTGTGDEESPEREDDSEAGSGGAGEAEGGDDAAAPGAGDSATAPGGDAEPSGESGDGSEEGAPGGADQEQDGENPDDGDGEASGDSGDVAGVDSDEETDGEASSDGAGDWSGGESDDTGEGDAGGGSGSKGEEVDESGEPSESGLGDGTGDEEGSGDQRERDETVADSGLGGGQPDDEGSLGGSQAVPDESTERQADSGDDGGVKGDNDSLESDDGSLEGDSEESTTEGDEGELSIYEGVGESSNESYAQEARGGAIGGETDTGTPERIEPVYGAPGDVSDALDAWLGHAAMDADESRAEEMAITEAVKQSEWFDERAMNVLGVKIVDYDKRGENDDDPWRYSRRGDRDARMVGVGVDIKVPESILGPALMRMRVAFSTNARGRDLNNLKSGKVNARVLGKRVFGTDERLFKKRILPGKRDYFVLIGMDVSGSTVGENIRLEKRAVAAQAELLSRMGIKFSIYAHTGNYASDRSSKYEVITCVIKSPEEHWTAKTKERLDGVHAFAANLDGHTLEFYRKQLDAVRATDKIIMYYTDGAMPLENFKEELEVLQREIAVCRKKSYTLMAVGINTDSPLKHGLDTVQVSDDADIVGVVKHLERRLLSI